MADNQGTNNEMTELFPRLQQFADFVGPNNYVQALIYVLAFVIAGKIADWIVSGIISRFVKRSMARASDDTTSDSPPRPRQPIPFRDPIPISDPAEEKSPQDGRSCASDGEYAPERSVPFAYGRR